jgi:hypothetical protein
MREEELDDEVRGRKIGGFYSLVREHKASPRIRLELGEYKIWRDTIVYDARFQT